jgi:hypothetical protein
MWRTAGCISPGSHRSDEHVPQLKKRDTTIVAISDVFEFRLIDDDRHFCKLYQPMRFNVIHTSLLIAFSRHAVGSPRHGFRQRWRTTLEAIQQPYALSEKNL